MTGAPGDWRPPHAYVPGRTPRHPEGLFDPLKTDIGQAWRTGLEFLDEGYFWEAHEVLEAVWMAAPPNGPEKLLVQGVIQIANARLKQAMGRPAAADKLLARADALLDEAFARSAPRVKGLTRADIEAMKTDGDETQP